MTSSPPPSVTEKTPTLLPCPFCGKEPLRFSSGDGTGTMIECVSEGCANPSVSYYGNGVAEDVWNTRSPAPAAVALTEDERAACEAGAKALTRYDINSRITSYGERCAATLRRLAERGKGR